MPLSALRVLDCSRGLPGAYCVKMLVDAGAEVIRIEPPEGSPLRRYGVIDDRPADQCADAPLFRFLAASTRSVVGRTEDVLTLAGRADLVVHDGTVSAEVRHLLTELNPRLIVVSLTDFGTEGPWADR